MIGHRRHGYLAAAGVGTSMVAGFALALLVVSAVIGFRGWPTSSATAPSSVSVLPAADAPAAGAARVVGRVILPAARVPARLAPARGSRRAAVAPARPPTAAVIPSRPAAGLIPKTPAGVAPTTVTDKPAAPRGGDDVRGKTQDAGVKVQQTTQQAAQSVAPMAPAAGDAVQATGQAVAGAIKSTGETLGGVLDALALKGH